MVKTAPPAGPPRCREPGEEPRLRFEVVGVSVGPRHAPAARRVFTEPAPVQLDPQDMSK